MPSSIRVFACASLLASAAACQKAEFDSARPEALVVSISSGVISADDGTLTVAVEAVEDGAAVLNHEVTATIGGDCAAAPQTAETDPGSGLAIFSFTGLDAAGSCTVTATAVPDLSTSATFEVLAGVPDTISLTPVGATDPDAGESVGYLLTVVDGAANPVAVGVNVATDAPGATVNTADTITFTVAGSYQVYADVIGVAGLTDSFPVTVAAAAAAEVTAELSQTSLAQAQTLDVTCTQYDAFGNERQFDWDATDLATVPAATIVEDATTNGLFHVTGFPSVGIYTATCNDGGGRTAVEAFSIVQLVDAVVPTQQVFAVSPVAANYAAGTVVAVNFDVTDAAGVAYEAVGVVSGPGRIISSPLFLENTTDPPQRSFSLVLEGTIGSSSSVVVRGQAADINGNTLTTADITLLVNAAATVTDASVNAATVEAGSTLVVSCTEANAVTGSSASTNFVAANVTTTSPDAEVVTEQGTSNVFDVTGLVTKGSFTATCTGAGDNDTVAFSVVDTTPPSASVSLNPAAGPYAPGTILQVTVPSTDVGGLSSASIVLVSGAATIQGSSTVALAGATSASPVFNVRLDGSTTASSSVVLTVQVADTTGNILQPANVNATVNQAGTSVVTTLEGTSIEHTQSLDLTCSQRHAVTGADTGATFAVTDVSTTATGASVAALGGNAFRLSGFTAKGNFTATCSLSAQSDIEGFTVIDTTVPTIGTLSVQAATGPNGITPDNAYAPGTTLTIRLTSATDAIGLARLDLSLTGSASILQPNPRFVSGTSALNTDFMVVVGGAAPTFSSIVITAQAVDTTGNTAVSATLTTTVDPAVAIVSGATIRTLVENVSTAIPTGMGTDGTNLFVQRRDALFGISDVVRVSGSTGPAIITPWITTVFPVANATGGVVALSTPFGTSGKSVFHTLGVGSPQLATHAGAAPFSHVNFDPTPSDFSAAGPTDATFGSLGFGDRVFTIDPDAGTAGASAILESVDTGEVAMTYDDSVDGRLTGCRAVARDTNLVRLLVADPDGTSVSANGAIHAVTDQGALGSVTSLVLTGSIPANGATDIVQAPGGGKIFIAGGNTGDVYRVNGLTVETAVSTGFLETVGLAIKTSDSNSLNVLDIDVASNTWRIYRVTGY